MSEKERLPERVFTGQKEYAFKDGVEQALEKIKELLSSQDYVVVGIAGPFSNDTNVGKTKLLGAIGQELYRRDIPWVDASMVNEYVIKNLLIRQESLGKKKGVIIIGGTTSVSFGLHDNELTELGREFNLSLSKIDVGILIYRPDKVPDTSEMQAADILINNKEAKDR